MKQRITICIDIDADDRVVGKFHDDVVETIENLVGSGIYKESITNMDSSIDIVKDDE